MSLFGFFFSSFSQHRLSNPETSHDLLADASNNYYLIFSVLFFQVAMGEIKFG